MLLAALLFNPFISEPAYAYIGPGAGFAFLGSTFIFLLTFGLLICTVLFWPLGWLLRKIQGKGISSKARTRRVVILGLDGLEPKLTERFMEEGILPNMKALKEEGVFQRLGTTLPSISPVAWSTFQTGVNPGGHNIFDFLTRDKRFCVPMLSSTVTEPAARKLKLGRFELTLGRPKIHLMRKSQPFWKILGKKGIFSNILRIPISYPPERFFGNILSAMCTPDLRGTQGTFTYFTTGKRAVSQSGDGTGGEVRMLESVNGRLLGAIDGPPDPRSREGAALKAPFSLSVSRESGRATLEVGERKVDLELNRFSEWLPVVFTHGRRKQISGICRFCLREAAEEVSLYVSPVNIDPARPVLPIAHPLFFSMWLARKQGAFGTLGLMEDTWGRNEGALDDSRFLEQTWITHEERRKMFFNALDKTREGLCACVFDASDRIQHMFWRYLDSASPAPRESGNGSADAIPEMYRKMDELVGETRSRLRPGDVLIVMSDHGFSSFRRGVNLNTWLMEKGYLAVKETGLTGADYLRDVDWSRTRAFAVGLAGLYINRKGRERCGIVPPDEAEALKKEIAGQLELIQDPQGGERAIRRVYDSAKVYRGIYKDEAPDLIAGYAPGYRVSWDSVTGTIEPLVFSDNVKAWSGDHHIDPKEVPGVFFSNLKLKKDSPHIVDIAPTVLDLFAVPVPEYMEGKVIL